MSQTIILPGYGGSGEAHWQTLWERADAGMVRFQPSSWDQPDLQDWITALDRAVAAASEPPLLVAHSLACLLVPHWAAARPDRRIAGAFLVAVPDPDGPQFPEEAPSFRAVPDRTLPFPTLIIASTDDPFGTTAHAERRARAWGAGFIEVGALGHINSSSGLGDWPLGAKLLSAFRAGLRHQAG
ncbi:RBBP9/YdeN family alpha/beta hydrolase [Indioceanicola profundi]|uniref:RBBP9/YdeN family alpha/beta hydrolase n=1 Tax=Indioceanicola profundi TaxID=2220096 RepID=UPI000E6ABF4E|nr:alpha/beta hydrolase [Indioceanicola profundi]